MSLGPQSHGSMLDAGGWQGGQAMGARCNCLRLASRLLERIPTSGIVPFDLILQLHGSVLEQWRQTMRCRHCSDHWHLIQVLTTTSEKIISLFEAASAAYSVGEYSSQGSPIHASGQLLSPVSSSSPSCFVICTRTQMRLGDFVLQDDEANMLAVQVIYKSLVAHFDLLEDVRDAQSPVVGLGRGRGHGHAFGVVKDGPPSIQSCLDRLLRMLGRIHVDQDLVVHR